MIFRNLAIIALVGIAPGLAKGVDLKFDSIQVGSVTYSNVVITKINPSDIYFAHTGGMANIKMRQLDPRLQRKFNYDPKRAKFDETERMYNNEEYKRRAVQNFNNRVAQEQAGASNAPAAPFSLTDPFDARSPLNRPAPPFGPVKWISEAPPQANDKFTLILFWNNASLASREAIPTLDTTSKNFTDKLTVIGLSSDPEKELKDATTPINFYSGSEPAGSYATALGVTSVPTVALTDPKGIIRYVGHPAALTDETLNKLMTRYAAE